MKNEAGEKMKIPHYHWPVTEKPPRDLTAAIWAAFWLVVLTAGEPDLLGALVGLVGRLG